jgi:hypothetical protein
VGGVAVGENVVAPVAAALVPAGTAAAQPGNGCANRNNNTSDTKVGEPCDDTAFDGRSDYQAFIDADIP